MSVPLSQPDQVPKRSPHREELEIAFNQSTDRPASPFQLLGLTNTGGANPETPVVRSTLIQALPGSDSGQTQALPESDQSQTSVRPKSEPVHNQGQNLDHDLSQPQINILPRKAPLPPSALHLAQYLDDVRDPKHPTQTLRLSWTKLAQISKLSVASIKRGLRALQQIEAITIINIWGHVGGGTVYELTDSFPRVLELAKSLPEYRAVTDPGQNQGQDPGQNQGHMTRSSSSFIKETLLQKETGLQKADLACLVLSNPWSNLDRRSLTPYLAQFTDLEALQDFLDRAAAALEVSGGRIQDPMGFVFACLRRGYVNAPPQWKSRRVLAAEAEVRRLTAELEKLRQLATEQGHLRREILWWRLSPEERKAIQAEAERLNDGSALGRRRAEQHRQELLTERLQQVEKLTPESSSEES